MNQENLKSIPIPLPPMEIQRAIVEECAVVDAEYETSRMSIEEYRSKISKVFVDLEVLARGGVNLFISRIYALLTLLRERSRSSRWIPSLAS